MSSLVTKLLRVVYNICTYVILSRMGFFLQNVGSYSTYLICSVIGLCYFIFCIEEPISVNENSVQNDMKKIIVDSVKDTVKVLTKAKSGPVLFLILIQLFSYGLLWFNFQIYTQEYYYMILRLTGFTSSHFSYFDAVRNITRSVFMLFVLPRLSIAPSLYCVFSLGIQTFIFVILPWPTNMWMYFTLQLLDFCYYASWSNARTLFTFCVDENNIGKIYALVGIVAALAPLASNPAYRNLYNAVSHWDKRAHDP